MSKTLGTIFLGSLLLITGVAHAYVASSPNYRLQSDSINFAGGLSTSSSYTQESTVGEVGTGYSSGANTLHAGFQQYDAQTNVPTSFECSDGIDNDHDGLIDAADPGCHTDADANNNATYDPQDNDETNTTHGGCLSDCPNPPEVPNVTNFQAVYQSAQTRVALTWVNPVFPEFAAVRIVRTTGPIATDPGEGILIYDGPGELAYDYNVTPGVTYYYTAFVRSTTGAYSSGVLASVTIPSSITPPPPPPPPPPCTDPTACPPGGGTPEGPIFPTASTTNPLIDKITTGDFFFVQPGGSPHALLPGGIIRLDGAKSTTVYIDYDRLPEVLKTIVVTLVDPEDPSRTFTFLLRVNEDHTRYTATIGPLIKSGNYRVIIQILNYSDESLRRLDGNLLVAGTFALALTQAPTYLLPFGSAGGLAVGVAQAVLLTSSAGSLYELYLLLLRGFGALLGFLGLRRKQKPWGVVYDAVTKRPIDPALVVVKKDGKEITTAITDLDGRYGFFLPAGTYEIIAGKTHYQFPSKTLGGRSSDELYDNLYYGEAIQAADSEVITRNIPLDPVGFDWNEFIKNKVAYFKLYSRRELWRARILDTVYLLGFCLTLVGLLFTPSTYNIVIMGLYIVLYIAQKFWQAAHKIVTIKRHNGEPLPYVIVTAMLPGINQKIRSVVTDGLGRFYMLISPGTYYFTAEEKQPDGTYQKIYQSEPMNLKKGVLTKDIVV